MSPATTLGQKAAEALKAAKVKAMAEGKPLTWDEVASIIDSCVADSGDSKAPQEDSITAETIYAAYPRKVGRSAALKAILKAMQTEGSARLLSLVQDYAKAVSRWPASERQFVPHPATWFNQGRYLDDQKEWQRGSTTTQPRSYTSV